MHHISESPMAQVRGDCMALSVLSPPTPESIKAAVKMTSN